MNRVNGMVRRRIVFTGTVQGVGFRWRAIHAAYHFGCTGWCRNEGDGSVTMEIQGDAEQIDQVIGAIRGGRYIDIERMDIQNIPPEDEDSFTTD